MTVLDNRKNCSAVDCMSGSYCTRDIKLFLENLPVQSTTDGKHFYLRTYELE